MSDFNQPPGVPEPPMGAAPSPFGAPAPPAPPSYATPGFPVGGIAAAKPQRPAVTVGASMLVVGAVMMIAGSFLTWFSILGESYTGFSTDGEGGSKDGPVFVFLAVLLLAFGIAQLAARKVLALGIVAIVIAALGVLAALADIGDVSDAMDIAESLEIDASSGPGLWVILIGALVALAGAIATVAKRHA